MNTIIINENLIFLDKIHFIRKESSSTLLVSFGKDFLRIVESPKKIEAIFRQINNAVNEEFSNKCGY